MFVDVNVCVKNVVLGKVLNPTHIRKCVPQMSGF